ncbi:MAG: hypothetical protein MZV49_03375 [Rhodopseudomonas palustris]|nr:hypothetical protein [Rhodopseudomonas palustris]
MVATSAVKSFRQNRQLPDGRQSGIGRQAAPIALAGAIRHLTGKISQESMA